MSTTTLTPPELAVDINSLTTEEKKELIIAETASITSGTTIDVSEHSFTPIKSLHINSRGIPVIRFPLPPSKLETAIYNFDGSLAYLSTRAKRSSGNCVLTDAKGKSLISTSYWCGFKDPVLHCLDAASVEETEESSESINEIKTVSKWTSRHHTFLLPDGRKLSWRYKKEIGFGTNGKKGTALVLDCEGKRIATLIRNDETRTPGSKSCSAGNGGELVLGQLVGGKEGVDEELVVATCLLMLKKEIDRRRTVQFMTIAMAVTA